MSWGGHAFSCDIQECSGGHPEWHIQGDVLSLINGNCEFDTADGKHHIIKGKWDLIIAHPPCTYLSSVCTRAYSLKCNPPEKVAARLKEREKAVEFFMHFINADCEHIAVENPVGYMNTHYRKPNQIIHPYYFVNSKDEESYEKKRTCLWTKNLPLLQRTNDFKSPDPKYFSNNKPINWCESMSAKNQKERAKIRSKTFPSIARALATTYYDYLIKEREQNVLSKETCCD